MTKKIFCETCNRKVAVTLTDMPTYLGGQASLADPDLVCLEMTEKCVGGLCPVCGVSADAMAVRLAKSGLRAEQHVTVRATCDGCQRDTDLMLTHGGYLSCPECGTTRRMARN